MAGVGYLPHQALVEIVGEADVSVEYSRVAVHDLPWAAGGHTFTISPIGNDGLSMGI